MARTQALRGPAGAPQIGTTVVVIRALIGVAGNFEEVEGGGGSETAVGHS